MFTVRETKGRSKKHREGRSSRAEEASSSDRRRITAEGSFNGRRQFLFIHGHLPSVRAHTTYGSMHNIHHMRAR